jgi:hypothetical protein
VLSFRTALDARPVSKSQLRLVALAVALLIMDGYDTQAIGYVAPVLSGLWRALAVLRLIADFGYARLTDIDTELEKLAVDARRTPEWICDAHLPDQPTYLQRHCRPSATRSRLPTPVRSEPGVVPVLGQPPARLGLRQGQGKTRRLYPSLDAETEK